jgi:hypothetical protein
MSTESDVSLAPERTAADVATSASSFGRFVHLAAAYAVIVGVLWYIQSGAAGIIDPDGYYHIRWSRLLWENLPHGRLPHFVWLPLTILNERAYVDHHFLFHILQIPFTFGGDLIAAAKASAVLYGALALLSCYALVVWARVRYPVAWLLLLLACSGPFLFRMSLPRAPAVTVATLALALFLLFTRRYVLYGVLSFFLVWMYSLFPLVGVLALAWAVGVWVEERRVEWRPVVFAGVGLAAGLLVNPYFPQNLYLFADHVRMKLAPEYEVSVGNEWYPYETWYLLTSSAVAWAAQLAGWVAMRTGTRRDAARTVCLFLFSTFLLVLVMKSRRFIEYWPAFAVLYAAFALRPYLERWTWSTIPAGWTRRLAAAGAVAVLGVALGLLVVNVRETRSSVEGEIDPTAYAGAARWLVANTPEGSMVFNTDWDDFPMLFYYDTHNVYASGLDPTYLLHADPDLSKLYEDITLGKVDDPAPLIRDRFGARYAFTDTGHTDFIDKATADGAMKIVYEDEHAAVLEIQDAPAPDL